MGCEAREFMYIIQWARYESSAYNIYISIHMYICAQGACFVNRLLLSFIFIFLYDPFKKLAQQGIHVHIHTHTQTL